MAWTYDKHVEKVIDSDLGVVCGVVAKGELIAAAPDLLEACKTVESLIGTDVEYSLVTVDITAEIIRSLRAAIAKAT